jgi:hypothetical protein
MKIKNILLVMVLILVTGTACNTVNQTTKRLTGDWQIVSFEEQHGTKPGVVATNVGSLILNADKTGKRIFSYSIMGLSARDTLYFDWSNTTNSILIKPAEEKDSKVWFISEQSKKKQTWKTTDGGSTMQIMKFERKKD